MIILSYEDTGGSSSTSTIKNGIKDTMKIALGGISHSSTHFGGVRLIGQETIEVC
jgi:hypothetical protein